MKSSWKKRPARHISISLLRQGSKPYGIPLGGEEQERCDVHTFSLYLFTKEVENALLPPSSSNRCICHLHAAAVDAAAAVCQSVYLAGAKGPIFSPKNAKKICL